MDNRLFRSQTDQMIGGVCGGLARYFGIDSTLIRLIFVLFTLAGGGGVIIYIVLWVIIPKEGLPSTSTLDETELRSRAGQMRDEFVEFTRQPNPELWKYGGAALVLFGIFLLVQNLNISWLWWLDGDLLWPALLVLIGAVLFWRALKGKQQ